ncbi:MAG: inorganic pyrophosphatase [Magnetococcales bacterium]|nr:inorganic pyrophosphatase [Magnetococcales bacterium]|tara:strand:+ start:104512 stop:105009 length:498 start_codon:yes stop_codon:yes gene_type:complete
MSVEVQIEIPRGSNIKYEYDHVNNKLIVDRIISTPVYYFFNYGYIPNTLGGDDDPLDAIVLSNNSFHPTCYINCKVIGVLETEDEKGIDDKIILVPEDSIDKKSSQINDIEDIDSEIIAKLKFFFSNYKKLESNKWVKVNELGDKKRANEIIKEGLELYKTIDHS